METQKIILVLISFILVVNSSAWGYGMILPEGKTELYMPEKLNAASATYETMVLSPYKIDTRKIKEELELYRKLYLFFAIFQGYVLINAASGR